MGFGVTAGGLVGSGVAVAFTSGLGFLIIRGACEEGTFTFCVGFSDSDGFGVAVGVGVGAGVGFGSVIEKTADRLSVSAGSQLQLL